MTDVAPQIATLPWANGMLTVLPDGSIEVRVAQKKLFGNGHTMKVVSTLRRDQVVRFETRRWPDGSATLTVCVDKGGTRDYQGVTPGLP